jgi:hypothetical protein
MDDDELTVNSSITKIKGSASPELINARLFEVEAASLLELACIAITNLSCNSIENKACFVKYKVHTILRIIVRDEYHQQVWNGPSNRQADDGRAFANQSIKNESLISLLRSTYNIVKSAIDGDPTSPSTTIGGKQRRDSYFS